MVITGKKLRDALLFINCVGQLRHYFPLQQQILNKKGACRQT